MLEFAVPASILKLMQQRHGNNLERYSSQAQIEIAGHENSALKSIHVSGSAAEVAKAEQAIMGAREIARPDAAKQAERIERGTQGRLLSQPVTSVTEIPSTALAPWRRVVRHRMDDMVFVEMAIPIGRWNDDDFLRVLEDLNDRTGVSLKSAAPTSADNRSVLLSGSHAQVISALVLLYTYKDKVTAASETQSSVQNSSQIATENPGKNTSRPETGEGNAWVDITLPSISRHHYRLDNRKGSKFQALCDKVGCKAEYRGTAGEVPVYRVTGAAAAVEEAKQRLQNSINDVCAQAGIPAQKVGILGSGKGGSEPMNNTPRQAMLSSSGSGDVQPQSTEPAQHQHRPKATHSLRLRKPKYGDDLAKIIGTKFSDLDDLQRTSGCAIHLRRRHKDGSRDLNMRGTMPGLMEVKEVLQQKYETICDEAGIERRGLEQLALETVAQGEEISEEVNAEMAVSNDVASDTNGRPNETQTSGSEATAQTPSQKSWITVRVPDVAHAYAMIVGTNGRTLQLIAQNTGCRIEGKKITGTDRLFQLYGYEIGLLRARNRMQKIVDEVCEQAGIASARVEVLKESESGLGDVVQGEGLASKSWITVRVPDSAGSRGLVAGAGGSTLLRIQRTTKCTIEGKKTTGEDGVFRLSGAQTAMRSAISAIQEVVDGACARAEIVAPRVEVLDRSEDGPVEVVENKGFDDEVAAGNAGRLEASDPKEFISNAATSVAEGLEAEADAEGPEEPEAATQNAEQLSDSVRAALRTLTHPVVLLTATLHHSNSGGDAAERSRGVTVSSFNTVTLAPTPIVSFNLKLPSRSWDAIKSSGRVQIHLLHASAKGAAVAHAFTQPHEKPSGPFYALMEMGAGVLFGQARRNLSPRIVYDGAVIAAFSAKIMRGKEVKVGDHMVVFAEVTKVITPEKEGDKDVAEGLAYGQRGYRGLGRAIEVPEMPSEEQAQNETDSVNASAARLSAARQEYDTAVEIQEREDGQAAEVTSATNPADTGVEDSRTQSNDSKDDTDLLEKFNTLEDDAEESEHNEAANDACFGAVKARQAEPELQQPSHEAAPEERQVEETAENVETGEDLRHDRTIQEQPLDEIEQMFETALAEGEPELSQAPTLSQFYSQRKGSPTHYSPAGQRRPIALRSTAKLSSPYAWGVEPEKEAYSTFARSGLRPYSTTVVSRSRSPNENNNIPRDCVTDPNLLKQTIGDFLGTYYEGPSGRIKALLDAKKATSQASRRLQRAMEDGTLTAEQSAHEENVILSNERKVSKKLAIRSAKDLQRMLDLGRVDFERARWLESTIEKGQAVLLAEARQAREMLEKGKLDRQRFDLVKESLGRDHGFLDTELLRLRQMVDEESDTYEDAAVPPTESERTGMFDGFRGNL